jgi:hypothetical protein
MEAEVAGSGITIGEFELRFQRTLRIPDDGKHYPLPPGLGTFPVFRVADYASRVPASWRERGGVFIPMYQREALWLSFDAGAWPACAVKVGVGKVDAVTGAPWDEELHQKPQDYVVCPDQPWLDGIKAGKGIIRQFVAMPLGMGYSVEGQVTGREEWGGLQIKVFAPREEFFARLAGRTSGRGEIMYCMCGESSMGLAAGGRMRQKIYPDPYGLEAWDTGKTGRVFVHICNSQAFREITGLEPPPTPVGSRHYTELGLPWFDLADGEKEDVPTQDVLAGVKSVKEMDEEKGFTPQQDDDPVAIEPGQVVSLGGKKVGEGKW